MVLEKNMGLGDPSNPHGRGEGELNMARDGDILFSVIIPSTGNRPKALQKAVSSVDEAARFAGLETEQIEILVGYDGVRRPVPEADYPVRAFNLPSDNDWGNGIRDMLLKIASGEKILFVDDDNVIKPYTLRLYLKHFDAEMIIGRIDTQLSFETSFLPEINSDSVIRPGNVDPLCLCLSRRLVVDRCGGWQHRGRRDADTLNIVDWHKGAQSVTVIDDVVGIYDAGRSLDYHALSGRQEELLDRLAVERNVNVSAFNRSVTQGLALA